MIRLDGGAVAIEGTREDELVILRMIVIPRNKLSLKSIDNGLHG